MITRSLAAGIVLACSATGQEWPVLYHHLGPAGQCPMDTSVPGPQSWLYQVERAARVGDVDLDGVDDLVFCNQTSRYCTSTGSFHTNTYVHAPYHYIVVSGADQGVLTTGFVSPFKGDRPTCVGTGDVTGDGRADLLAAFSSGVYVLSGADGSGVRLHPLPGSYVFFDRQVFGLGDIDADGTEDYAFGARLSGARHDSIIWVHSGATGGLIFTQPGDHVADLGDIDGDGHGEFAIADLTGFGVPEGSVTVISGRSLTPVFQLVGRPGERFGSSLTDVEDLDGDGVRDLVVGATSPHNGAAYVYSGRNGQFIRSLEHPFFQDYGTKVVNLGDIDSDGLSEIGVHNAGSTTVPESTDIYSGAHGVLLWSAPPGAVDSTADVNQDGHRDIVFDNGEIRSRPTHFATATLHGAACNGATSPPPAMGHTGRAGWGHDLLITLRNAPAQTPIVLHLGDSTNLHLDPIGMPGCTLYCTPYATLPTLTSTTGSGERTIHFTPFTAPIGTTIEFQWAILAPGQNPLGITLSEGLLTTIGA